MQRTLFSGGVLMKPVIALRHVPHEGLGLLEPVFREQASFIAFSICRTMRRGRSTPISSPASSCSAVR
jgi:hypothetical protein